MGEYTSRSGMYLPGGGSTGLILPDEVVDIDKINSNFRTIDKLLGARNIPSASGYDGAMDGDLVYAQDTGFLHMYSGSEARLLTPRLPGARQYSGTAAERTAFAVHAKDGDLWRDTNNVGLIWVFKAGSPGTWEYSGNRGRGTKAAMDQMVTDGIVTEGMRVTCTDDNCDYMGGANIWLLYGVGDYYDIASFPLTNSGWNVYSSAAHWKLRPPGIPRTGASYTTGMVAPVKGEYRLSFSFNIATTISGLACLKRNNTVATASDMVVASEFSGVGTQTGVALSNVVALAAGDVITPALWVSNAGGGWGITPLGTKLSLELLRQTP